MRGGECFSLIKKFSPYNPSPALWGKFLKEAPTMVLHVIIFSRLTFPLVRGKRQEGWVVTPSWIKRYLRGERGGAGSLWKKVFLKRRVFEFLIYKRGREGLGVDDKRRFKYAKSLDTWRNEGFSQTLGYFSAIIFKSHEIINFFQPFKALRCCSWS